MSLINPQIDYKYKLQVIHKNNIQIEFNRIELRDLGKFNNQIEILHLLYKDMECIYIAKNKIVVSNQ